MGRQEHRRPFILLPLAILAAMGLTLAVLARHDAPPVAAVGENSLTFPDPDTANDTGSQSSMKLDANGFPVVAYRRIGTGPNPNQIRLLHCNDVNCEGGDDSVEIPYASPFGVLSPSLTLDSTGNPIITFVLFGTYVLHCNDVNCAGNDESLVVYGACCPSEVRHVLAPGDLPVVFFRQNGMQMLRCANTNCTSLSNDSTLLVQPANTYSYSFALDGSGFPVVGYIGNNTASGGDLMLMHCNDLNCDPAVNGAESNLLIDDSTVGGRKVFGHVALTLVNGNPVIAYSHYDMSTMKVARCNDPNCAAGGDTIEPLNTVTGAHSPGMAVDSGGFPVVSYYDGFGQTFVLHCNDASCSGSNESNHLVLDHGNNSPSTGSPPSVALDANGFPIASMYHSNGNDLAILHCGDVNCSVPALPTPTNTPPPTNTPVPPTATNTPPPPTPTPTTTPGGSTGRIVFTSNRNSDNFDLFTMDGDGSSPTCLTNSQQPLESYRPDWSPDGTKVVFTRNVPGSDREIFVMNADSSNIVNLTNHPNLDDEAVWSPDGTKIAFVTTRDGGHQVYVMNADGSNPTNITNSNSLDEFPAWSPDGTKIAFTSYRDTGGILKTEIYVMNADGSNVVRLTTNTDDETTPAWSPDGSTIAFASTRDGDYEVYTMDADDGANQTRLTESGGDDFSPKYSPDGAQIAFTTGRDGNYEIYVMAAADGANPINLSNSPSANDSQPSWTGLTPIDPVCPAPEPTATPTASNTPTATNTSDPSTPTATNTPVPPTSTATNTPTNTAVPPSATNTPVPATATSTNTPTNTPVPPTATNTPTSTAVPPTATNTAVPPTATPTATNTPVPPTATATNTPTNTAVPATATSTNTSTNTAVPATATSTNTSTNTPTNTAVPPTATATNTPTNTTVPATATATATNTATNTAVPSTATRTNTPTNTAVPATATATRTNTPTATATVTAGGVKCADVSGDGKVNSGDILRIALVWVRGQYLSSYDLNGDGKVDFGDIVVAAMQFGRRC